MSHFYYSASCNAVYDNHERERYTLWPEDCLPLSDEQFTQFFSHEWPEGKIVVPGKEGYPVWGDIPRPTAEAQQADFDAQRTQLITQAQNTISVWQTELQLGMISDSDKESLTLWIKYIQQLRAIDTSQAEIRWPMSPK